MRCPWQTVEDTYKYRDMSRPEGYGIKKVTTFGECLKAYCPFYHSEDKRCDRVDVSTGRLQYEDDPKEGTAEEGVYWTKQLYQDGGYNFLCGSCGEISTEGGKYCPNCGKKMNTSSVLRTHIDAEAPYITDLDDIV